jgi:predicted metal-dependent hydrolase
LQAALFKLDLGQQSLPVLYVRNPKARRYILRMLPDGRARVTIPRGGSLQQACGFAERNKAWIQRQLAKAPAAWGHGTTLLLRGEALTLRLDGAAMSLGPHAIPAFAGDDVRLRVEAWLRALAGPELTARAFELAALHAQPIARVRVANQRTRWGSCSISGTISLNWRLIQTPPFVRDYIIVHELMHLREMNHSPRFWKHVAAACPAYEAAEKWLHQNACLLR